MNFSRLAMEIARIEKGKREVNITQIREILRILSDMIYVNPEIQDILYLNGKRRDKRFFKRKKK